MSDYTPTTEEVRASYVDENVCYDETWQDCAEQFDRWLEQHNKEVRAKRDQELVEAINELPRTQIGDYILGLLGVDEDALIKQPTDTLCQQGIHSWTFGREVCLSCGIKGDVTERLQNEMSPNGYTEGENK